MLPRSHSPGRRRTYPLRRIVDAIFYLLRTGAQWRLLPHEFPPHCALCYHYAQWRADRAWEHMTQALRQSNCRTIGQAARPTAPSSTVNRSWPLRCVGCLSAANASGGPAVQVRRADAEIFGNPMPSLVAGLSLANDIVLQVLGQAS
ncbi:transposase [Microvirga sp. 0TCS3.31]